MPEYIERESLLGKLQERDLCLCVSEADIKELPASDVAPVVHGRWVLKAEKGGMDFHVKAHCSECGYEWFSKDGVGNYSSVFSAFVRGTDEDAFAFVLREASKRKLFISCPVCGAKMDKEDPNGD